MRNCAKRSYANGHYVVSAIMEGSGGTYLSLISTKFLLGPETGTLAKSEDPDEM